MQITNPVLRGFNPDPSIVRVDDDYYIATSTFEWFPGVQIHHSRDLVNWRLITRPLCRLSQLDMTGNPDSGGVWAPCLTYADGQFWLIYTDVKHHSGAHKITHNYLVTSTDITGPWSDPVYLNSSGFDPSLFHDDDGRKWLLNMNWDWRPGVNRFAGILLQEYDHAAGRLVGEIRDIFAGSSLGVTEGPHLYRRSGYYYLLTAEGGTGHRHAVTIARSRAITGPYEIDPENPVLTAYDRADPLKKAGHADIVETPDGWYMVHLCSRPIGEGVRGEADGWSTLGRETAIQKVEWTDDGWLRLAGGGNTPAVTVPAPRIGTGDDAAAGSPADAASRFAFEQIDEFNADSLGIDWQTLRRPLGPDQMSLTERPGYLRLYGAEPPVSAFRQSLVARRQQAFRIQAQTFVEFEPADTKHIAGLICYYNTMKFHYLYVTAGEIGIMSSTGGTESFPAEGSAIVPAGASLAVHLRATIDYEALVFEWSADGEGWQQVGPVLDATILSDELGPGNGFTGAFVGLCCQDLSGRRRHADFERFVYRESEPTAGTAP